MSQLYEVQRTDESGHWRERGRETNRRYALLWARGVAAEPAPSRRCVSVRVKQGDRVLAVWINGQPSAGLAYSHEDQ